MTHSRTNSSHRIALSLFSSLFLLAITSNIITANGTPTPIITSPPKSPSIPNTSSLNNTKTTLGESSIFAEYTKNLDSLQKQLKNLNNNSTPETKEEVITLAEKIREQAKILVEKNLELKSDTDEINKILLPIIEKLYLRELSEVIKEIQTKITVNPINGTYGSTTQSKVNTVITQHIESINRILYEEKNKALNSPETTKKRESSKSSVEIPRWLPWLGGGLILFAVEAAQIYMIWEYRKKIKSENDQEITRLNDDIENKKTEIETLKKEKLSSNKSELDRAKEQQQIRQAPSHSHNPTSTQTPVRQVSQTPVRQASHTPPAPMSTPEQLMVKEYNSDRRRFSTQYTPKLVAEDAQALSERWGGEQKNVVLTENSQGDYWVFGDNRQEYLVPTNKVNINEFSLRTVGSIFECENYTATYRQFQLIEPAKVSVQSVGGKQAWRVESKGRLLFS
jgi:hypothetical protein